MLISTPFVAHAGHDPVGVGQRQLKDAITRDSNLAIIKSIG